MTQPGFDSLCDRLLAIAGREVKPAPGGEDNAIDALLKDGRSLRLGIDLCRMQPGHCNVNMARLWRQHSGNLAAICTGYALDTDGTVWRQHWWGISNGERIVETTVPRSRYFGIDFTGDGADKIAADILRRFQSNEDPKL